MSGSLSLFSKPKLSSPPPSMASSSSSLFYLLLLLPFLLLLLILLALRFFVRPRAARIPIKNRHVLVTGGSSGIGLAVAAAAAAEGASRVSILARSESKLKSAAETIRRACPGADVVTLPADVTDLEAVEKALAVAGDVDVLVCNQGIFVPQELEKQPMELVRSTLEINLMGTFHLIKSALPGMKRRVRATGLPASIAITSSQAGQVGVYGYTAYSASKFALRGLAEALQHEVIADDIHVSMIFPPDTDTPGYAEERKCRPELTNLIAESSSEMKVEAVARKALDGIKRGLFIIPCNFDGMMLAIATAGLSPQSSARRALVEVLCASLMRFVGLAYQWNWFSTIEKWHAKKKSEDNLLA